MLLKELEEEVDDWFASPSSLACSVWRRRWVRGSGRLLAVRSTVIARGWMAAGKAAWEAASAAA